METKEEAEAVCFICKRTAYITHCKGCLYNNLKKGRTVSGAESISEKKPTSYGVKNVWKE